MFCVVVSLFHLIVLHVIEPLSGALGRLYSTILSLGGYLSINVLATLVQYGYVKS